MMLSAFAPRRPSSSSWEWTPSFRKIAFNWLRRLRPLSVRQFLLLIVPMAVDGGGQFIGLWSSTWLTRVITGALFGVACIGLTYPYLEQGMREVRAETSATLERWGR